MLKNNITYFSHCCFHCLCENFFFFLRCRECCRTLLPGSYKLTEDPGSLVCTHHFTRSASDANQNGHSEMSNKLAKLTSTSPEEPKHRSLESKASLGNAEITPKREEEELTEIEKASSKQPDSRSEVETEHSAPCLLVHQILLMNLKRRIRTHYKKTTSQPLMVMSQQHQ